MLLLNETARPDLLLQLDVKNHNTCQIASKVLLCCGPRVSLKCILIITPSFLHCPIICGGFVGKVTCLFVYHRNNFKFIFQIRNSLIGKNDLGYTEDAKGAVYMQISFLDITLAAVKKFNGGA